MSLSQVQIIRSLGEALAWFEKELTWGVEPALLGHLTGRIGELYATMNTRGQMALATNQHGYDVIGSDNERISVKTVTTSTHVTFRKSTFQKVDRILVLRVNVEDGEASIEELLDCPASAVSNLTQSATGDYVYRVNQAPRASKPMADLQIAAEAYHGVDRIIQYENGTICVERDGVLALQAKPILRLIAAEIGVKLVNGNQNPMNTRQLGTEVLAVLNARGNFGNSDKVAQAPTTPLRGLSV
ncbi:DUF6998 domain-containing protein [Novosphingobium sp.]|uniref:DUF6998 domain-containing protein n=1 Tax=Novosphingobium sp. TaxID=1874826 RepID=UPI003D119433